MRKAATKMGVILIVLGSLWIYGCGSGSDLFDEQNSRYTGFITLSDAGEDDVLTIDVLQNLDCDGDPLTNDPEIFTDVLAEINIDVAANALGITLRDYSIEYIPLSSPDQFGAQIMPPDLTDLTAHGATTFTVPSDSIGAFGITGMSVDTKAQYVNNWPPTLIVARYIIRITLNFEDENLEDRQIILERTVYLSNYDNC